jgi:heat shock protein HtpX
MHVPMEARRASGLSTVEWNLLAGGLVLLAAAVVGALSAEDAGGIRRLLGVAGIVTLGLCAAWRAVRIHRAGLTASLPAAVGRAPVPIGAARGFAAATIAFALVLPCAVAIVLVALVEWMWLPVAGVLVLGGLCAIATGPRRSAVDDYRWPRQSEEASELLRRLCMRADMVVPELIVEPAAVANAWTARGRIHLTLPLIELLDRRELEAVIAHEVAHLARRDAAVMEICSAPSRVLLAFAGQVARAPRSSVRAFGVPPGPLVTLWFLAALCVPAAFVVGWTSRLSVLGSSRAREFSADAAASALTGRPSALASALMKLEGDLAPDTDLRELAVLCIVGGRRSWFGRAFATHPATRSRVKRLEALEARVSHPYTGGR